MAEIPKPTEPSVEAKKRVERLTKQLSDVKRDIAADAKSSRTEGDRTDATGTAPPMTGDRD